MSVSNSVSNRQAQAPNDFYRAVWRWHFYAGVVVAPLLLVLASSGLVMLLRAPLEAAPYGHLLTVTPLTTMRTPAAQAAAVDAALPQMQSILFVPPSAPDRASEFSVVPRHSAGAGHGHNEAALSVFVDPYTARVLGTLDRARTPYGWANAIHGTLLLGDIGDAIVEIAAGLAVLLIVGGLYLARARQHSLRAALLPPATPVGRVRTRDLHGAVGYWIALPLLFFLFSGLTWTGTWGGRVVQAWSTLSLERKPSTMSATQVHRDLGRAPLEEVPWALEQTPLPVSGTSAGETGVGAEPDLDRVAAFAQSVGFEPFRIALPRDDAGVWTISASTLAGDVDAPSAERFLHLDRHTGRVLADVGYAHYSLVGRFMASGVPFHQGELGVWNISFNAVLCLAVMTLVILATALWWQRKPNGLLPVAPPRPDHRTGRRVLAGAVFFPLSAAAIALVLLLDRLFVALRAVRSRA